MRDDTREDKRGWRRDDAGREYRAIAGGAVREYRRREDRDAAVEESYHLSPAMRAFLDEPESVFRSVMGEAVMLAELYHRETGSWWGETAERLDRWSAMHFGRRLEPSLRAVLAYEIRRRMQLGEGGRIGPEAGPFRDYPEQLRYESAAARVPAGLGSFERVTWIASEAGAALGPGPRPFPEPPDPEAEANRQRALLPPREPGEEG